MIHAKQITILTTGGNVLKLVYLSVEILERSTTDFHYKNFCNWGFPKFQSFKS